MANKDDSLYQRINLVKRDIKHIAKSGKNQHFNYQYATESDISAALRPLMADHGVCLLYHGPDRDRIEIIEGTTSKGGANFLYRVWVHYELVNTDNPTERETVWAPGEALDNQDKGMNKALTAAAKYAWLKIFDISTGDAADDADSHAAEPVSFRKQPAPPPAAATPEPTAKPAPKVFGAAGADRLKQRLKKSGIGLDEVVAAILAGEHAGLIKGVEGSVAKWPIALGTPLLHILEGLESGGEVPSGYEGVLEAISNRWDEEIAEHKPAPNQPQNPLAMLRAAIEFLPDASPKELLSLLDRDEIIFPTGEWVKF